MMESSRGLGLRNELGPVWWRVSLGVLAWLGSRSDEPHVHEEFTHAGRHIRGMFYMLY